MFRIEGVAQISPDRPAAGKRWQDEEIYTYPLSFDFLVSFLLELLGCRLAWRAHDLPEDEIRFANEILHTEKEYVQ